MRKLNYYIITLTISALLFTGCSTSQNNQAKAAQENTTETSEISDTSSSQVVVDTEFSARDLEVGYEESTAVNITLKGDSIEAADNSAETGAVIKGSTLTINKEGTYVISGTLDNGQIIVDAGNSDKIHIVFAEAAITCMNNAPVYVKNADKVFITLKAGTTNSLTDGTVYVQSDDNNVDGVIYSKADLTINGEGTLTVTGNYKHGIVSKDDLVITGGKIIVTAVKDALNGKDCVKIKDGTLTLSADTGNGIQSKNDEDATKGYVYVAGGTITVLKSNEGIEGTVILIEDGVIDITSEDDGLNSASGINKDSNQAGVKFPGDMDRTDKDADMTVNPKSNTAPDKNTDADANGSLRAPDAETSDATTGATAGTEETDRPNMPERPEGTNQNRDFGQGNFGGGFGGGEFEADTDCYISIKGGTIHINAAGDGIDSNGYLYVSGGSTYVSGPTDNGNGALDYNGTAVITGGTILAAGSTGMAQGFSDTSTQYSLLYNLTEVSAAGTEIKLTDETGKVIASYKPDKKYQSIVISTPDLTKDKTYTLTCGDQTAQITLSSVVTSNGGGQGMGGPRMGEQRGTERPSSQNGNTNNNGDKNTVNDTDKSTGNKSDNNSGSSTDSN